ncbi:Cys-tRNA(Pro) deacylase [Listeria ilorinensis]|uniref:Cys-tRNA(Pro) deacylase n=1 Tax=Listeria ilorinensis TaxID=2867439 RepID=UPI001EF583DF|nr:Cys-tRNA(Pro) deacylase [Listeria ilorinensis]
MAHKTNACRLLDQKKIPYTLHEYTFSEDALDAVHVAQETGQDPGKVFKTLVANGDKTGHLVACIPADRTLDLKKLAKISGNKKCELIHVKDLEKITGYIRGGCSPIGMKKLFPTFLDQSADQKTPIFISAGKRGLQVALAPENLLEITRGRMTPLT